jgi:hypothetical protein
MERSGQRRALRFSSVGTSYRSSAFVLVINLFLPSQVTETASDEQAAVAFAMAGPRTSQFGKA